MKLSKTMLDFISDYFVHHKIYFLNRFKNKYFIKEKNIWQTYYTPLGHNPLTLVHPILPVRKRYAKQMSREQRYLLYLLGICSLLLNLIFAVDTH